MNVEDLIIGLFRCNCDLNKWDGDVVTSFYEQLTDGLGFTEKQSLLAIRILKKHSNELSSKTGVDVAALIENPVFRLPVRKISNAKTMNIVEIEPHKHFVEVRFPYNEKYIAAFKKARDMQVSGVWGADVKAWIFPVSEGNLRFLINFAKEENFTIDEELEKYGQDIENILSNIDNYIPALVIDNKIPKIVNFPENLSNLETTDIRGAIFEARKLGIMVWDETISNYIESDQVSELLRNFLKSDPSENFQILSENNDISCLTEILLNLGPTLFVLPGGSEMEKLAKTYEYLKTIDIANDEISVMFRLPSATSQNFNEFVKFNQLNSPITKKTKIVFISGKLPKTILKSGIKFHSVINLGFYNAHYTMKEYLKNQENLVSYIDKKYKKEYPFAFL